MTPLLCFFKPPDSEKLLPLFLHLNCLSRVWSLHVSSIHQILRSSCQTMCTHSFSTVGGVLLYLLSHLMKRSNCHIWCTCMPFCSWFHSRGGKWADFYGEIWYVPSLLVTGSPMRSLMWRGCAKWTTAECCAVHTENRLLHGFEPENGKSGRAMFRALVWGFQKAIILGDSCKIVGGDVSGRFWILFYSIRDNIIRLD